MSCRLGVRLSDHAYMFPEGVDVGAAGLAAHMQGGVLCWVRESDEVVDVESEDGVVAVPVSVLTWVPV